MRLQEALGRMRGNYREAIVLRFGLGLTAPEIAEHLGISLPAAKKLLLRATRQARERLVAIEGQEFCPQMRELARRSLFEKEASGLASEDEERILHAHFEHCGSCRSFLASLRDSLHELGGGALLAGVAAGRLGGGAGALAHLARRLGEAAHGVQAGAAKLRFAAFKATGAFQPADAGSAGVLAGTGQKIAAICTAGVATTATCLATGIVGPGIGASAPPASAAHHSSPAKVKAVSEPASQPPPASSASSAPDPRPAPGPESGSGSPKASEPSSSPPPSETPAQQGQAEFGIEHSAPPAAESAPAPQASAAGSGSSSSPTSSGSAGKGGTESFGFHG